MRASGGVRAGALAGLLCGMGAALIWTGPTSAQDVCDGKEFCQEPGKPPPPCYAVEDPETEKCDPDCKCGAEDYPACDPEWQPGELSPDPACGRKNPCDGEFASCVEPPIPCDEEPDPNLLQFRTEICDKDAADPMPATQIYELATAEVPDECRCATVVAKESGYYAIFNSNVAESCETQVDESSYLTIANGCNPEGTPVEHNVQNYLVVQDSDNQGTGCDPDDPDACGASLRCRKGRNVEHTCCVPDEPLFMGTFLLLEGENKICLNHWCPKYKELRDQGEDWGFVTRIDEAGVCSRVRKRRGQPDTLVPDINSVHFGFNSSLQVCKDERTLRACAFGCNMEAGACNADPCDSMTCDNFCKDGVCVDDNPCTGLGCEYGCKRGYCLQPKGAPGPDKDGDGFSELADCDDDNAAIYPGAQEVCGNEVDDNCDGQVDEPGCIGDRSGSGGSNFGRSDAGTRGPSGDAGAPGNGNGEGDDSDDCNCRVPGSGSSSAPLALLLGALGIAMIARRRRR